MKLRIQRYFIALLGSFVLLHGGEPLLFYCGVTMVPTMKKIAALYTRQTGQKITIIQGGSGELLKTLIVNQNGDLYLPGNPRYITETQVPGLFPYHRTIGHMNLILFTRAGNPFAIRGISDLMRNDVRIAIGSPGIGSIGKTTQKLLTRYGGKTFFNRVGVNALYFAIDSRDMNHLFLSRKIDVGLTWKPALTPLLNQGEAQTVSLNPHQLPPVALQIALIRYSKHPEAARAFINLATSSSARTILEKDGFDVP